MTDWTAAQWGAFYFMAALTLGVGTAGWVTVDTLLAIWRASRAKRGLKWAT